MISHFKNISFLLLTILLFQSCKMVKTANEEKFESEMGKSIFTSTAEDIENQKSILGEIAVGKYDLIGNFEENKMKLETISKKIQSYNDLRSRLEFYDEYIVKLNALKKDLDTSQALQEQILEKSDRLYKEKLSSFKKIYEKMKHNTVVTSIHDFYASLKADEVGTGAGKKFTYAIVSGFIKNDRVICESPSCQYLLPVGKLQLDAEGVKKFLSYVGASACLILSAEYHDSRTHVDVYMADSGNYFCYFMEKVAQNP